VGQVGQVRQEGESLRFNLRRSHLPYLSHPPYSTHSTHST
jgi:hypothetical protein